MRLISTILVAVCICLAPTVGWCDLSDYRQDFEGLAQGNGDSLANDGWLAFANVFTPTGGYLYGYGPFPAPNGGPAFSGIDVGQGGVEQGLQQLVVYSDYNNGDHANGNLIEANVFQEQMVGATDAGNTWLFEFQAKRGNIDGNTTATAFIKTLDPNNGWALTNLITVDMTDVSDVWRSHLISIYIEPGLAGQILQFGFLNVATYYEASGIFYDNVSFINLDDQCADDEGSDDDDEQNDIIDKDFSDYLDDRNDGNHRVEFGPNN